MRRYIYAAALAMLIGLAGYACLPSAKAAEPMAVVQPPEATIFIIGMLTKIQLSPSVTVTALVIFGNYPDQPACETRLAELLKTKAPTGQKASTGCFKMTKVLSISNGTAI